MNIKGYRKNKNDVWFEIEQDTILATKDGTQNLRKDVINVLRQLLLTQEGLSYETINALRGTGATDESARKFMDHQILPFLEQIGFEKEYNGRFLMKPVHVKQKRYHWTEGIKLPQPGDSISPDFKITPHRGPTTIAPVNRFSCEHLLHIPCYKWVFNQSPISALFDARYHVVPFWGRTKEMASLTEWCMNTEPISSRLIIGPGGMGKTRLCIKLVESIHASGWCTGFLDARSMPSSEEIWKLLQTPNHLLIVLDYAEEHSLLLEDLIRLGLRTKRHHKIRIIVNARQLADWWTQLQRRRGGVSDFFNSSRTQIIHLDPVAPDRPSAEHVFKQARCAFSIALQKNIPACSLPNFEASPFERVLFIHLAALASVFGRDLKKEDDLLEFVLNRERDMWNELGGSNANVDVIEQAATMAFTMGGAEDREKAIALLQNTPMLEKASMSTIQNVTSILHSLYPGPLWLNGIQPDLLGERLILLAYTKAHS